jgi:ABC-type transport system involved in multi-copper enzyme maturation permease subunit
MIGVIYKREILDHLKSAKFLIGFGLTIAITVAATVINVQDYGRRLQDYRAAQRDLPANKFEIQIFRPPELLSILVQGKDRALGTKASVNYLHIPDRLTGYMLSGSGAPRPRSISGFGSVDFAFLVRVVLSLLVIFLAFDAVAEEKQSGTLKLALANALPRSSLLIGKAAAGLTVVLGSLVAAAAVAVLIMMVHPMVDPSGADAARILSLVAASALYLTVFYTLSLLVSTAVKRPAIALMVLLQLWIFLVVVYPHLGVSIAENFYRLPTDREMAEKKNAAFAPYADELKKVQAAYFGGDRASGPGMRYLELQSLRSRLENDVDREFSLRLSGQLGLARWISVLSPAALFNRAAERYARTDIEEYDRFLASVERYWKTKYMDLQMLFYKDLPAYRKAPTPPFDHPAERTAEAWIATAPQIVVLALLALIFFAAASTAFLRKDVR